MLLINPPSPFLLDERVFPNLGILRVAEAVDGDVLDLAGVEEWEAAIDAAPDHELIGLSATTPQMPRVMEIARYLRHSRPHAELVIGGPHVTLCQVGGERAEAARQTLLDTFDAVVAGDGEKAILDVVAGQRGLIRADRRQDIGFLPDGEQKTGRHRIDIQSYRYEIEGHRATSLIAQLGCPFNCGFCGGRDSHAFRVIRKRDTDAVVREIEGLYRDYGFTGFMFLDDELNVNRQIVQLMNGIADLQERLGADFRLRGFIKAELFTEDQAAAMYRAGFRWILSGFEAAHPRILRNIQKRATVSDNTRVCEIADKFGMKVKALMSMGHPGESEDTARAIEKWLLHVKPSDFDLTVITPYPGSPYYDRSVRNNGHWTYEFEGDALHSEEVDYSVSADFYKGVPGEYVSHVWTDHLTQKEICGLRDEIEYSARTALGLSGPRVQHEHSMGSA